MGGSCRADMTEYSGSSEIFEDVGGLKGEGVEGLKISDGMGAC